MVRSLFPLFLVLSVAGTPPTLVDKVSTAQSATARETVLSPLRRYNWDLRLASVEVSSQGISSVKATLRNLSGKRIRIDRTANNVGLGMGMRLWKSGLDGSYRMYLDRRMTVDYFPDPIDIDPGQEVSLSWDFALKSVSELPRSFRAYSVAFHRRHAADSNDSCRDRLARGEYVVDATLELSLWEAEGDGFRRRIGSVILCTGNKFWVTLEGNACDEARIVPRRNGAIKSPAEAHPDGEQIAAAALACEARAVERRPVMIGCGSGSQDDRGR